MSWRVKIDYDVRTGGDVVTVARQSTDEHTEFVAWEAAMGTDQVAGRTHRIPSTVVPPDMCHLRVPEGVLDALVAERRTPGPSDDLVAELRAALAVERGRVDRMLDAPVTVDVPVDVDVPAPGHSPSGRLCGHDAPSYVDPPSSCLLPAGHNGSTHGDGVTWWGQS